MQPQRRRKRYVSDESRLPRRLIIAMLMVVAVAITGTLGYHFIEGWPLMDGLYMTVITMATIGYGETRPLDESGRLFTIGLIFASIGIAGYAISTVGAFIVEGQLYNVIRGRRMDRQINLLKNHIILCGAGHTGKWVAEELFKTRTPFVIIEQDENALSHISHIDDMLFVEGDATSDTTLRSAGIERARGLVTSLGADKDNVFVVLTARSLNPKLRIVARVVDVENTGKLMTAGADDVVSANAIGGLRMASVMLRPSVVSFLDQMLRVAGGALRVEEVAVNKVPDIVEKTLMQADVRGRSGMLVVAVKRDKEYLFNPDPKMVLRAEDVLIVMGTPEQIDDLIPD
jgi:voltage-gated potassium channel